MTCIDTADIPSDPPPSPPTNHPSQPTIHPIDCRYFFIRLWRINNLAVLSAQWGSMYCTFSGNKAQLISCQRNKGKQPGPLTMPEEINNYFKYLNQQYHICTLTPLFIQRISLNLTASIFLYFS